MTGMVLAAFFSAVNFVECPKCVKRIRISDDGKDAFVNMSRVDSSRKAEMEARAERLLAMGKPVEAANPLTPLMGWSSWNTMAFNVTESIVLSVAEAMHTNGLQAAGYNYVNIDDGFFAGSADQFLDACAHGNSGDGVQLNAVEGDCADPGSFNHFGIDGHLHGFENVATGKVDCCGLLEIQFDVRFVGGDESLDDAENISSRHVMRFEQIRIDRHSGFATENAGIDNDFGRHFAESHANQLEHADPGFGK